MRLREPRPLALSGPAPLPGCGVHTAQHPSSAQVSSHFSGHPGVLPTPISGSPFPRSPMLPPGFCTRRVQRLRKSFTSSCLPFFPGPPTTYAQPTRGPPTLQVQTDVHKKPSGLRGLARCSPTRRPPHLTPGATHTPTLRCQSSPPGARSPAPAAPPSGPRVPRARLPGAWPARAPGTPRALTRRACPGAGGGGCSPNSAASPSSSWPPSSPASWRSLAAPLPGPCWPATPGGARGSGATAGLRGVPEA